MKKTLKNIIINHKNNLNTGITFIEANENDTFISYNDLLLKANSLCSSLYKKGLKKGDTLVFNIEDNLIFVLYFWACILGGIIPVPVIFNNLDETWIKLKNIYSLLDNAYILIENFQILTKEVQKKYLEILSGNTSFIIETSSIKIDMNEKQINEQLIYPDDTAFIQFSSGSTGIPKGVVLSHNNLMTNIDSILKGANVDSNERNLCWLPLTHDMGLIGNHLAALVNKMNQYLMPPQLFIRNPLKWMDKITEYKINISCSPNFGYNHFIKFFKRKNKKFNWELSSLRIIFNGAEPISIDNCNHFLETLSEYGLANTVIFPVYGLAEASLAVTFPPLSEKIKSYKLNRHQLSIGSQISIDSKKQNETIELVDVGFSVLHTSVKITDIENYELPENFIGLIKIKGENVTKGYYKNTQLTNETIDEEGWLNTGDIGFLKNNRLIVTGRMKDIIFMFGENYYSHDIERIAETFDPIKQGSTVAIGITNQETQQDDIILFISHRKQELQQFSELANKIKNYLLEKYKIPLLVALPLSKIPRTTSGKIQRYKLMEAYINGDFDDVKTQVNEYISKIRTPTYLTIQNTDKKERKKLLVDIIKQCMAKILGNINYHGIDENCSLGDIGIDSSTAIKIQNTLSQLLNINISVAAFYSYPTINLLADYLLNEVLYFNDIKTNKETIGTTDDFLKEIESVLN